MVLAGALLAASLAVWLLADRMPPEERSDKALLPAPLGPMILLEPRQAGGELKPFVIAADAAAARQQCLALGDVTDEQLRAAAGGPEYALTVPGSAGYRVWVRAWWLDGCANSCLVAIDDQPPVTIGNDSTYRVWHWVRGPVMDISAGPHILRLLPRDANVRVDQILLAANHAYQPHGVLADSGAPAFVPPDPGPPPVWPSADRPGKAPFLAGIGGMFQAGPEAFMVRLGIPYRRLRDDEVHDLATLEKFNLVWISSREGTVRQSTAAVEAYVSAGGTAIIENGHMMYPEGADLIGPLRLTPRTMAGGVSVKAAGAPLLRRLPDCPLPEKVRVCGIRDAEPATGCEMHGQLFQGNDLLGPVFVKKRIGRGTVYFLCVPLGHVSLWKGKWFDQVTEDILRDAVDGRCDWLFAGLSWNPKAAGAGRLDDEFMRSKGAEWPGWQVISGQVEHTGSAPSDRSLAFSLRAGKEPVCSMIARWLESAFRLAC